MSQVRIVNICWLWHVAKFRVYVKKSARSDTIIIKYIEKAENSTKLLDLTNLKIRVAY
jgi:hypothetical protein